MAIDIVQPKTVKLGVVRKQPELVGPAQPTPRETKELSDIDDQKGIWCQMHAIWFYRADPSMRGKDPAKVVKDGLAKALVFYYPLAGRLTAGPAGKLVVDCTGEGVLFIEAKAEAKLEDFGDVIHLPFPLEELIYDVPGTKGIVDTPLLIIQVTSLKCGGFIVAMRANHVMLDASGRTQFMSAVGEMARGLPAPVTLPVWQKERLNARPQPHVTCTHYEYEEIINPHPQTHKDKILVQRCLLFGPTELATLRNHVSLDNLERYTTFEILSASLWRCRTIAFEFDPNEEVRMLMAVNARSKFNPPVPKGYYGNTCGFPVVRAIAGEICRNPINYVLELIRQGKKLVTEEYLRSVADLMVTRGRPCMTEGTKDRRIYEISDHRHVGYIDVDFGWGKPVFGGPGRNWGIPESGSFFISYKNKIGESMIMVPIAFPSNVMERFIKELHAMLKT